MHILRIEVIRVTLGLVAPYVIANDVVSTAENLFVRLVTGGVHVGLGCAAPEATVTGETHDACHGALLRASEALVGRDPLRIADCLHAIREATQGAPAARAAIDTALWDHLGKVCGQPVWRLLGGFRTTVQTSITIFVDKQDEMVRLARERVAEGFGILKLKGGLDVRHDLDMVAAVRAAIGPQVALWLDANEGWTEEEALWFAQGVAPHDLELLEQPTRRGAGQVLQRITEATALQVGADESLLNLEDAWVLAKGGHVDLVNVKLMKVGGIDPALAVNAVARAAGMETMIGCMDEAALGIAAGLAVALARRNVRYADLDGHLDLLRDPTDGAVVLHRGWISPAEGPGFGRADL